MHKWQHNLYEKLMVKFYVWKALWLDSWWLSLENRCIQCGILVPLGLGKEFHFHWLLLQPIAKKQEAKMMDTKDFVNYHELIRLKRDPLGLIRFVLFWNKYKLKNLQIFLWRLILEDTSMKFGLEMILEFLLCILISIKISAGVFLEVKLMFVFFFQT